MKTTASLEESAKGILAIFKEKRVKPGGVLHQSGLLSEFREMGFDLNEFHAATEWLTSNGYLAIPRSPLGSYMITEAGLGKAA